MAQKLVGQDYTTPDLHAKVTGRAKYAEDFRAEGMLFAKLLVSPMPHARVARFDPSRALALEGVKGILTADDMPGAVPGATLGEGVESLSQGELAALTWEPVYQGEPILAVAAVDEETAAQAIELIDIEFEPLPFNVDPIDALRPGSANARTGGNTWMRPERPPEPAQGRGGRGGFVRPEISELKWTEEDFAQAGEGMLPTGKPTDEWSYGDLDAAFAQADLVLEETILTQSTCHQPLETRSAMAYWQNGKVYLHGSTQSTVQTVGSFARWAGVEPENVVMISEYTGGGFGSKIPGSMSMAIPALLSKKVNAPVMMRMPREDEHFIGRARSGVHGRVRAGFRKDGKLLALDMFTVGDNGPYDAQGDYRNAANIASLAYQPTAMRWRGITVLTNTPPRTSQRAPGGMQAIGIMEPVIAKAAKQLGIDQVEMRLLNSPEGKATYGPANAAGRQGYVTSSFIKDALRQGREVFRWDERKAQSGQRNGTKVRGLGVAVSTFFGGSTGFDGLIIIRPDGRLQVQSGIGNLGTESVIDVHRVAAEMLGMPWEKVEINWGNTANNLPWTCISAGSQTAHAMTRAAHAAASDAKRKLQEIAARELGGRPEDYVVDNERVFRRGGGAGLTLAQAAQRAIALGGKYDGHELPESINQFTRTSATALAGLGLMGVAKDEYPRDGNSMSFVAGFAEVEVDVETGQLHLLDYLAVGDVGTVLHPRSLGGQLLGGSMLGIGHAITQRSAYDTHYGAALSRRFYQNRPPTILDAPRTMGWAAVDKADPETPTGVRGVGEPPVGAGYGAVMNAVLEAVGYETFRRTPITPDILLEALENGGMRMHEPLTTHI